MRQLHHTTSPSPPPPGIFTGSTYRDKDLIQLGMVGEHVTDNRVLVVKDHNMRALMAKGTINYERYDKVSANGRMCWGAWQEVAMSAGSWILVYHAPALVHAHTTHWRVLSLAR
jgi:hypothetical protein